MKNMSVGELKAQFSDVLEKVQQGESFGILYGKNKKLVAEITPPKRKQNGKRKLGILEGKVNAVFATDFKMTEEEFISLGKK